MPSGDYAAAAGGALRLKGAKVAKPGKKHKHKKTRGERKDKSREGASDDRSPRAKTATTENNNARSEAAHNETKEQDEPVDPYARMTAAERRFAEAQDKKIRDLLHAGPEEVRAARPELFKSHKERLADLNTYLSRMSEHHDMPKIGPG
ncbi:DUF1754 domain containing protein [Niveomyces insectorum RCEF 264]|uniref:DUF1754 domain containing protein n=1 Tax=Niveomyces insectorum RCEF 264 TaxID=1081102 RepID=A0A162MCS5_9HYPO|nr:DUF1754 domain containing protein [Niveomyces insectorum RCEF 264]